MRQESVARPSMTVRRTQVAWQGNYWLRNTSTYSTAESSSRRREGVGFSCNADAGPRDARCRNRATGGDGASWATSDRPGGGGRGSKGRGWRRRHLGTARAPGNSGGSGAHPTRGS